MSAWINNRVLAALVGAVSVANLIVLLGIEGFGTSSVAIVFVSVAMLIQLVVLGCTVLGFAYLLTRGRGSGGQFGLATLLAAVSTVAVFCGLGTSWGWQPAWWVLSFVLVLLIPGLCVRYGVETRVISLALLRAGLAATLQLNFSLLIHFAVFGVHDYLLGSFGPATSWTGASTALWGAAIYSALATLTMAPLVLLWFIAGVSGLIAFRRRQDLEPWTSVSEETTDEEQNAAPPDLDDQISQRP